MSETYTVTAKTIDEALDLADKLYGGKNKEISHEIVSMPKKGFLGFGSKEAVVKVTVTNAAEAVINTQSKPAQSKPAQPKPAQPKPAQPKPAQPKPVQPKPAQPKPAQPKPVQPKPVQPKTVQPKPINAETEKADNSNEISAYKTAEKSSAESEMRRGVSADEMNFAVEFVSRMIANMNLKATASPVDPGDIEFVKSDGADVYPEISITGEDTGVLIGHHGETLDSIQYLVNLAIYRNEKKSEGTSRDRSKITVDIEGYRAKREETLRSLARRMAARTVKYKKNMFLEPMNPYERRIIHSELQDYPDVATHSVGSDTNRKIIITYEGADKAPQKKRSRAPQNGRNLTRVKSEQTLQKSESSEEVTTLPKPAPLPKLDGME